MNISRRNFLEGLAAGTALAAAPGCASLGFGCRPGRVALQLYSINRYIAANGLEKALRDVKRLGYEGVEFAGYWNHSAKEIKTLLDDIGLVAVGTHVTTNEFSPEHYAENCEFNLTFGNNFLCSPCGGNFPPGCSWKGLDKPNQKVDDFIKKLCETYNVAAENCAKYGCKVGLHNHEWEFKVPMLDGTLYWDYFFAHTDKAVCMEQDVGWTTCAGFDPCEQYLKYPGRSPTLHAKENGMDGAADFDAILGKPGKGAKGVEWDRLFPITDADGVAWYVVECEKHFESLAAVKPSWDFLHAKGRC